jgi:hypothetical protein
MHSITFSINHFWARVGFWCSLCGLLCLALLKCLSLDSARSLRVGSLILLQTAQCSVYRSFSMTSYSTRKSSTQERLIWRTQENQERDRGLQTPSRSRNLDPLAFAQSPPTLHNSMAVLRKLNRKCNHWFGFN